MGNPLDDLADMLDYPNWGISRDGVLEFLQAYLNLARMTLKPTLSDDDLRHEIRNLVYLAMKCVE